MASTKLTNTMRDRIVADLLGHRFGKAADKLVADRAAFALKVYRDVYSLTVRKRMEDLPNGWLPDEWGIRVQFGDGSGFSALSFNGSVGGPISRYLTKPIDTITKRLFAIHMHNCAKVYDLAHPLAVHWSELSSREAALKTEIAAARTQANAAVYSASTINGLISMWPEVEPFARKHETAKAALPALPTIELNRLLDLPVAA
jgi:hypothetical protein